MVGVYEPTLQTPELPRRGWKNHYLETRLKDEDGWAVGRGFARGRALHVLSGRIVEVALEVKAGGRRRREIRGTSGGKFGRPGKGF